MKIKTRKIAKQLVMAIGRIEPKFNIISLARRIEQLNRQINRRTIELLTLKEQLKPHVKMGHTRLSGLDIHKVHVKGHHVQPYFCKAYDSLHVSRL